MQYTINPLIIIIIIIITLVPVLATMEESFLGFKKLENIEIQVKRVIRRFKLLLTIFRSNNICLGDSSGFATF